MTSRWYRQKRGGRAILIALCLALSAQPLPVSAQLTPLPEPPPQPGSFGVEATKTQPPPTQGAVITTPGNGASFSSSPIAVNGLCPNGLLVQVFNNGVMVGAVMCQNGSFSIEVSLFAGTNELSAIVYDELGQAGPTSPVVTVTYTDTSFEAFGSLMTLTSAYGRRSAQMENPLSWPLQLAGGNGPYALSIDWGDGTPSQLASQPGPGAFNVTHAYKRAGIYQVAIRATDVNDVSAFLQVVAVSSGQPEEPAEEEVVAGPIRNRVLWWPAVLALILLIPSYWLGKRSQLVALRNRMLKERDAYSKK